MEPANMEDCMQNIYIKDDRAVKTNKSYCVNRDVICTLPKSGGNDLLRPSVMACKRKVIKTPKQKK